MWSVKLLHFVENHLAGYVANVESALHLALDMVVAQQYQGELHRAGSFRRLHLEGEPLVFQFGVPDGFIVLIFGAADLTGNSRLLLVELSFYRRAELVFAGGVSDFDFTGPFTGDIRAVNRQREEGEQKQG